MKRLPTLTASRVRLRWLTERDVPDLFAVFSDPETMRYWSSPAMSEVGEAETLLQKIHDAFRHRELYQWGIVRDGEDRVVGTCTLARLDFPNRRAEVGFALRRELWGQGLMTEALSALLDHAFRDLHLHRVEADVDPRNERSIRLLEKLGFSREGHLRERWIVAGETADTVFYGLLRREWGRPA